MTTRTKSTRRRPIISGLAVVLTAAAVLSFETLDKLAKGVGYTAMFDIPMPFTDTALPIYLSWLLPISVDAFGFLATVAWLTPTFSPDIRWFAKRAALGDLGGSAGLNALYHGMMAAGWKIATTTWVVIGVGALPPVMVFLSLHLGALVMDDERDTVADNADDSAPVTQAAANPDTGHDTTRQPDPTSSTPAVSARNTTPRPAKKATANTTSTFDRVAKIRAKQPDITQAAVATKLGVSERTVQRNWGPDSQPVAGADKAPDNVTSIHKEAAQ